MTCEPLAYTGGGQIDLLVGVAIACLVAGGLLLLMTRRRGRVANVALLVLICAAGLSINPGVPAQADGLPECPPVENSQTVAANSLTFTQTSVMDKLGPGIAPVAITGIITNNGVDNTGIIAVNVEITAVITDPGSAPGVCDASDYLLLDPLMPVGQTLDPQGSTTFAGASIGFNNKSTNQDTCQGATIQLLYTANPA